MKPTNASIYVQLEENKGKNVHNIESEHGKFDLEEVLYVRVDGTFRRCILDERKQSSRQRHFTLYRTTVYLVYEADVAASCLQQQTDDVCVPMFAGAHQGRGALAVLGIYIRAAAQEQLHHGNAAVAHREHECRLARLEKD